MQKGAVVLRSNGKCLFGYTGGILSSADNDPIRCKVEINHEIAIVGIKNVKDKDGQWKLCLVFQNSWGARHGEAGYGYILIEEGPGLGGIFSENGTMY